LEYKLQNYPIDRRIQSLIIRDIDRERYKSIADIDNVFTNAKDFLQWYAIKQPNLFVSGADYLTKALGWVDIDFRNKHPFGRMTREAFQEYEMLKKGDSA
jgi:hypothetical protein